MPEAAPAEESSAPNNRGLTEREAADAIAALNIEDFDVTDGDDRRKRRASSDEDDAEPQGDDDDLEDDEIQSSDDTDTGEEEEDEDETEDEDADEADADEDGSDDETDEDEATEGSELTQALGIEELAEALEIPQEQLAANLTGIARVDGQDVRVTFEEALAGYQRNADYTQGKQQLTEERKSFEGERTEARQMYERNNAVLATAMQNLQAMFLAPPDPAEMQRLRYEDPTEYTARTVDYQQRVKMFNDAVGGAAQGFEQFTAQQREGMQAKAKEFEREQDSILAREIPGWNSAVKEKLYADAAERYGFTVEEAKTVVDARTLKMVRDALQFHEIQSTSKEARRVTKKLPKNVAKPGKKKSRTKGQLKADNVRSAKARLRNSGKVRDAAAAIEAQMGDRLG